ncbi:MAG: endonuclease NucS [Thermoprotei archaeon ex4572_64]|nr:MAG: endonuclease NucS [Thermoprotei archaeon ex4572_64]
MSIDYILEPSPDCACKFINTKRSSQVIVLYGNLSAKYEGRARAELELAPRIVITKPDGTLMIHESSRREPVIWNPPGSTLYALSEYGILIIKSVRPSPKEYVTIEVPVIHFIGAFNVGVSKSYKVHGSEEDLKNYLMNNLHIVEDGLRLISKEYHTQVGSIDLLCEDRYGNYVAIEIKRAQAGPEAVHQLRRYVEYLSNKFQNRKIRGVLVAPDISASAFKYLRSYGLEFRRLRSTI